MMLGMSTATTGRARRPAPRWTLGDRIRKARRDLDMSQAQFATALGVGAKALAAWETDYNRPADLVQLAEDLERITGIGRSWFLGWDDGGGLNSDWSRDGSRRRRALIMAATKPLLPNLRVVRSDEIPAPAAHAA